MKSATFLILASASFAVLTILGGKQPPTWWPGTNNSPLQPFPSTSTPGSNNPSTFLSSALAMGKIRNPAPTQQQKRISRTELRIARGIVRDEIAEGLILQCSGWVVQSASQPGIYAGDGRGMNPIYSNLLVAHERLQFGPLLVADHGTTRESTFDPSLWHPESYLMGIILLKHFPAKSPGIGKCVKIVVAPSGVTTWKETSLPIYSAEFAVND